MKKLIENYKGCFNHIPYTWKHYLAYLRLEKRLLGYYKYKFHDLDKIIMFIFIPFVGEKKINYLHRKWSKHHPTYIKDGKTMFKDGNKVDWIAATIDCECARETKPDKPLNARDTFIKYYPSYREYWTKSLKKLRL